jgi:hypothetical protein
VCDSDAGSTLSAKIEEPPETGFRRDLVLRGLIVAMVQATDPRTRNNTTPNC